MLAAMVLAALAIGVTVRQSPEKADLQAAVKELLVASRRYATALAAPSQIDFDTLHTCEYPTTDPRGVAARANLLAHPRAAAPLVLEALAGLDLRTHEGTAGGMFCNALLHELFHGGFDWVELLDDASVANNESARKGWRRCLEPVLTEDAFWKDVRTEARRSFAAVEGFVAVENVLPAGASIRATTPEGLVEIQADAGYGRHVTWSGATRTAQMLPRSERWYGKLGLYFPGSGHHWREHDGITRAVIEEAQVHLASLEELQSWMKSNGGDFVYRNDGLLFSFSRVPERRQINVDVFQVFIAGKRPEALPGANDEAIVLTGF